MKSQNPCVLSIQSHMTYGRSGNRAAVLPLEVNGIQVDPLNTCHYSAHTAYPYHNGQILSVQQLRDTISALETNGILHSYTHLLTGYLGDAAIANEIYSIKAKLGNEIAYICDPVLGDQGKFYTKSEAEEQLKIMRKYLVGCAETITPNAYEAMWLTGMRSMGNVHEMLEIVDKLHELGPKNVIISSTEWDRRFTVFSWNNKEYQCAIETPSFNRKFEGPGDVFASLLLANMINYPGQYKLISTRTVNSVYQVLRTTYENGSTELSLHLSVEALRNPEMVFKPISFEELTQIHIKDNAIYNA